MKIFLILLFLTIVTIFTGTWLLEGLGWFFNLLSSGCKNLSNVLDFFGWAKGMV